MVQNSFQFQKRLKNYSKNLFFSKVSNDLKNVSIHCGGHYNIKFKHFEDFSDGLPHPPCQIGLVNKAIQSHEKVTARNGEKSYSRILSY